MNGRFPGLRPTILHSKRRSICRIPLSSDGKALCRAERWKRGLVRSGPLCRRWRRSPISVRLFRELSGNLNRVDAELLRPPRARRRIQLRVVCVWSARLKPTPDEIKNGWIASAKNGLSPNVNADEYRPWRSKVSLLTTLPIFDGTSG